MRRPRLALLALPLLLTACGHSATNAGDPFAANDSGASCRVHRFGSSLLVGQTVRVTRSVTLDSITAEGNKGIRIGSPGVSRLSDEVAEAGTWAGTTPTEPARTRLNWAGRAGLVGAQLSPGWYELWWTAAAASADASTSGMAIGWRDSAGLTGMHRIAESLRFSAHC